MDADDTDDQAVLANTPTQGKSQLHSLGARGKCDNSLYVNTDKTKLMCFKEDGAISTLSIKTQICRPDHIPPAISHLL